MITRSYRQAGQFRSASAGATCRHQLPGLIGRADASDQH